MLSRRRGATIEVRMYRRRKISSIHLYYYSTARLARPQAPGLSARVNTRLRGISHGFAVSCQKAEKCMFRTTTFGQGKAGFGMDGRYHRADMDALVARTISSRGHECSGNTDAIM